MAIYAVASGAMGPLSITLADLHVRDDQFDVSGLCHPEVGFHPEYILEYQPVVANSASSWLAFS